jgi:hypothetical protein
MNGKHQAEERVAVLYCVVDAAVFGELASPIRSLLLEVK